MTLNELAEAAARRGLDLGKNPARTIRYYIDRGLLEPPRIEYEGKVKRAVYSPDHLVALRIICGYKNKGYKLEAIKEKLKEPIYWSDEALEFMRPFIAANNYPADAFSKDRPVTWGEAVIFLARFLDTVKKGREDASLIKRAFLDRRGQPAFRELETLFGE
ncbi:MAG: hypothetical protein PWP41_1743 [Moorella sp. (in: firmicutes)]|uniref:HTH merR-type domain-containing protein n=1 Tax=Neomoorella thermoacetica TaxID=1525 RepID=A0A1J5NME5_NEOTH|nr:hypothetical protein [Moorella sp. (in: firmicutes)]OIQ57047.1 hypothetical protein MOTE_22880 [Moorella thermoacetica]